MRDFPYTRNTSPYIMQNSLYMSRWLSTKSRDVHAKNNPRPRSEVVCRYIPEVKVRGISLQTADDRGRGVYVHLGTASST